MLNFFNFFQYKQGGNFIDPHKELEKDFQSLVANMNKTPPEEKKEGNYYFYIRVNLR